MIFNINLLSSRMPSKVSGGVLQLLEATTVKLYEATVSRSNGFTTEMAPVFRSIAKLSVLSEETKKLDDIKLSRFAKGTLF